MTDAELRRAVAEATGLSPQEADAALRATLRALDAQLTRTEARRVAALLPDPLGDMLTGHDMPTPKASATMLYHAVAEDEDVSEGFGREHAQGVCRALGKHAPGLHNAVPDALEGVFTPRPPSSPPDRLPTAAGRDTLSSGKPRHPAPLSESPAHAHEGVVATTQPRAGEKLSDGTPGPARPVSTAGTDRH